MLVTDYDIITLADINGYPYDLSRVYHGTSIVWEPVKQLVRVTGTTVPATGVYVLYNPARMVGVTPQFTLEKTDGPQGHGVDGNTTTLDKFALWTFDDGKLSTLGGTGYLSIGEQTGTPDTSRDALLSGTGATITLDNSGVGNGEVYPMTGSFRLGMTVIGPNSLGKYTYYGPRWYNQNLGCYPDEYLILYRVEDVQA